MKSIEIIKRNLLCLLFLTVFYIGCDEVRYTSKELTTLQKGDTIYVENYGHIMMATIIINDTTKKVMQVNTASYYSADHSKLWMKEHWTYEEIIIGRGYDW